MNRYIYKQYAQVIVITINIHTFYIPKLFQSPEKTHVHQFNVLNNWREISITDTIKLLNKCLFVFLNFAYSCIKELAAVGLFTCFCQSIRQFQPFAK